jgi:LPXTG-motif cell wall-anchored protein
LKYSNDPTYKYSGDEPKGSDPAGETPEQEVTLWTTTLILFKHDAAGTALKGATFTLSSDNGDITEIRIENAVKFTEDNENGTYYLLKTGFYTTTAPVTETGDGNTENLYASTTTKYSRTEEKNVILKPVNGNNSVTQAVDDQGTIWFKGLSAGSYTLTETVTPAGYNTIPAFNFTVGFHKKTDTTNAKYAQYYWSISTQDDSDYVQIGENDTHTTLLIDVKNTKGSQLPETGGIGTQIIYVLGAVLAAAAVILLITRKRMRKANER